MVTFAKLVRRGKLFQETSSKEGKEGEERDEGEEGEEETFEIYTGLGHGRHWAVLQQ